MPGCLGAWGPGENTCDDPLSLGLRTLCRHLSSCCSGSGTAHVFFLRRQRSTVFVFVVECHCRPPNTSKVGSGQQSLVRTAAGTGDPRPSPIPTSRPVLVGSQLSPRARPPPRQNLNLTTARPPHHPGLRADSTPHSAHAPRSPLPTPSLLVPSTRTRIGTSALSFVCGPGKGTCSVRPSGCHGCLRIQNPVCVRVLCSKVPAAAHSSNFGRSPRHSSRLTTTPNSLYIRRSPTETLPSWPRP